MTSTSPNASRGGADGPSSRDVPGSACTKWAGDCLTRLTRLTGHTHTPPDPDSRSPPVSGRPKHVVGTSRRSAETDPRSP